MNKHDAISVKMKECSMYKVTDSSACCILIRYIICNILAVHFM